MRNQIFGREVEVGGPIGSICKYLRVYCSPESAWIAIESPPFYIYKTVQSDVFPFPHHSLLQLKRNNKCLRVLRGFNIYKSRSLYLQWLRIRWLPLSPWSIVACRGRWRKERLSRASVNERCWFSLVVKVGLIVTSRVRIGDVSHFHTPQLPVNTLQGGTQKNK